MKWNNLSLFWRLLGSHLLVIVVSCVSIYVASEAISPVQLDFHLGEVQTVTGALTDAMRADLEADLEAALTDATQRSILWGVVLALVIASAVSFLISSRIAAPIRQMQRSSRRIAAGHYNERLDPHAPGEVSDLAGAFNEMAAALMHFESLRVHLLGDVAHEFRTPLSSLRGYIEGLEDGFFDADAETLHACERQISRLEQLVGDISLLSRVEAGQERLEVQPTTAAALLEQVVTAFTPQFREKGVRLTLNPVPASLRVQADVKRTGQVLGNLIENALRHTQTGGRVCLTAETADGNQVMFRVTDSGEGVSEKDLPHLYTRFYRGDESRSREGHGSGIGLTLVKSYVELQGGVTGVESRVGNGSTFWFTLPTA